MTRDEIIHLQVTLNRRGFGPLAVDGRYGPQTAAAYARMLELSNAGGAGNSIPVPAPAKPWWASRAIIGSLVTVIGAIIGVVAEVQIDSGATADAIYSIIMGITSLFALYGTIRRKAPIDPTLVVPGVRLPVGRVQPSERVPTRAAETRQSDSPFADP